MRLVVTAVVLIPAAVLFGESIVTWLLPLFGAVFEAIAGDFKLLRLAVDQEGADRVLRATVMWKHIVFIGGHVVYPDPRGTANASTLLAHALQGPLVALLVTCAWPLSDSPHHTSWRELGIRVLALCPMLAFLISADVPVVLAGELWQLVLEALAPGSGSPVVHWKNFLHDGGRYALGLAGAVIAIQFAKRFNA
ncbi:hypothetical protein EIP75_00010 [Aquabacterium soli]|uniref:Uncharacterized protein n=1 Tax=Aquabacterium soli TaxID=2493092 RepID=A0A426VGJ0_9BURK|nr:hypothetical protein [Aquabacterium soli]RRS06037.1 hypothetical protein EIP75_00010 [Aquabacterium soli]